MKFLTICIFAVLSSGLFAQHPNLITNIRDRDITSLSGKWRYLLDINKKSMGFEHTKIPVNKWDIHEHNFPGSDWLYVPGDWNSQRDELNLYEGKLWYQKYFTYKLPEKRRLFIYFGAANYKTEVFINGTLIGQHEGGFTPFNFEISDTLLSDQNSIVVAVDNTRESSGIPPFETDWWNYGGITREVFLVETPEVFIRDYLVSLKKEDRNTIEGYVEVSPNISEKLVTIEIPELSLIVEGKTNKNGRLLFNKKAEGIELWSPGSPKLYKVQIKSDMEVITDKIGFRTIKTMGSEILLNGQPVFLKGICVHEENPLGKGRAWSEEHARVLLERAKELNCNFVRLAHYPHNEHMVKLADEMGIMIWEELPLYWAVDWDNDQTYMLAEQMATEMITRDKNRSSIIIWSVANETGNNTDRNIFLGKLIEHTRQLDNTRLISAALLIDHKNSDKYTKVVNDNLGDIVDIISVNQYYGWYQGLPDIIDKINWKIEFDKPFFFSEFGAGALQGYHGDSLTRWSEEYQEYYYRETLEMLDRVDKLRGISPWLLVDFKSPRRLFPFIQDYYNKKGLYSERGEKKKAFYLLRNYYYEK